MARLKRPSPPRGSTEEQVAELRRYLGQLAAEVELVLTRQEAEIKRVKEQIKEESTGDRDR